MAETAEFPSSPNPSVAAASALQSARERRGRLTVMICAMMAVLGIVFSIMLGPLNIGPIDVVRIGLGAMG